MKNTRHFVSLAVLLLVTSTALISAHAQITPKQDAYTDSSKPTINFGAATTLGVANTATSIQTTYIQFDLSSIPSGYTGSNIAQATLKLYVNTVTTAGSFNVDFVAGSWSEKTITANLAPALGSTIQASVPLTTANKGSYFLIDVTSALQAWLNGVQTNDGIALVANNPLSATFDSKENTGQSHPPELDVVFNGAITAVNTAAGSGLTGGGTNGALNLSLLTSCSSGQMLSWNGSAWGCANAGGTGTVTSAGLSAPASDFVVSGSPITTSGTLNISWLVPPNSSNIANAIVKRDSTGSFNATSINASGQISVNSGVSLSPIQSIANAANATAIYASSLGTGVTFGIKASTTSSSLGASGVFGVDNNSAGSAGNFTSGVAGVTQNSFGVGVLGYGVFSFNAAGAIGFNRAGVWGDDSTGVGVVATSDTGTAAIASNKSSTFATLVAKNTSTANALVATNTGTAAPTVLAQNTYTAADGHGLIFRAEAPNVSVNGATAACQVNTRGDLGCTGDVVQTRPANGLVKALVYFDPFQQAPNQITRCYNSTIAEPAASTPPCGFTYTHAALGQNVIDFGFTVSDRFAQVTAVFVAGDSHPVVASLGDPSAVGPTQLGVGTFYSNTNPDPTKYTFSFTDTPFYLTVF
jgi:hypothetical protein